MAARRALAWIVLAAAAAIPAPAVELGTLFYTPQERDRLDRLRRGEPVQDGEGEAATATTVPRVNGYLKRSDGRDTVFLDGRAYPAKGPRDAVPPLPKAGAPSGAAPANSSIRIEAKPRG